VHELMGRIHFTVCHGRESRPIAVVVEPLIPPAGQFRCHLELGDDSIDVLTLVLPHLGGESSGMPESRTSAGSTVWSSARKFPSEAAYSGDSTSKCHRGPPRSSMVNPGSPGRSG